MDEFFNCSTQNQRSPPGTHSITSAPFILEAITDAVLLVDDKENFLFANRAFEEMFDFPWCSNRHGEVQLNFNHQQHQSGSTVIFSSTAERVRFFQLVSQLLNIHGEPVFKEALVECMKNQLTGPFLSKVTFTPFIDIVDDHKNKCVCIFSDPLYYKKFAREYRYSCWYS